MQVFKKILAVFIGLIVAVLGWVVGTDYDPENIEHLIASGENNNMLAAEEPLRISIFNIGYGGLDASQDFFMDGGSGSKSLSLKQTQKNIEGAIDYLEMSSADIAILQEVDIDSKRSYKVNEYDMIISALSKYNDVSTLYYKVPFVPVPFNAPMGKVEMSLLTLSKSQISKGTRYKLPNERKIPDKFFLLDRCIMESVHPLDNGKNLVVLNIHLSAYDSKGTVKKEQLRWIENYIESADLENNYYVFGGDWNLVMTDTSGEDKSSQRAYWIEKPKDFKAGGFEWYYDEKVNTVRELDAPYQNGKTFERVIDGYLVSPNVEVLAVETVDLGFENSDHNPVLLDIKLK